MSAKESDHGSEMGTDVASIPPRRINKLGAILCPTICAFVLVISFSFGFIIVKFLYDQYDAIMSGRKIILTSFYRVYDDAPLNYSINYNLAL